MQYPSVVTPEETYLSPEPSPQVCAKSWARSHPTISWSVHLLLLLWYPWMSLMFQHQYQQSGWLVREIPATKPSHLSRTTIFALRSNQIGCPDVLSKGSRFHNRKQVYRFRKSTHIYSQLTGTGGTSELCKNHLRDAGSTPLKSNEDLMIGYSIFD